jgi:hypothetical protein
MGSCRVGRKGQFAVTAEDQATERGSRGGAVISLEHGPLRENTAPQDFAAITPLRCHVFRKASRSALIVFAWVVGMPCGKPS